MTSFESVSRAATPVRALILAGLFFAAEIGAIGMIFKHGIDFTCLENWPQLACAGASGVLVALYCMVGATLLFALLGPAPLRRLVAEAGTRAWAY